MNIEDKKRILSETIQTIKSKDLKVGDELEKDLANLGDEYVEGIFILAAYDALKDSVKRLREMAKQ
jgi:polyhydroxyalkanoate synthesis regulator phasin